MPMRVHELHPVFIHAPLVLLPTTALVDVLAATSRGRLRRRAFSAVGRRLWWATATAGLAAGVTGMAASQEVEAGEDARDMMAVHGIGNVMLVAGALGLAIWRSRNRANGVSAAIGAAATVAAVYTAWLGGEMVYAQGVGVKLRDKLDADDRWSPPLLSRRAPGVFARDMARGLAWLAQRGAESVAGKNRVKLRSVSPTSPVPTENHAPQTH